jgi:ubiquinone/menaquinone biosynthesis C-methylase UbiE
LNHHDHVNLLRGAVQEGGVWADFGSGTGAFTLALADLVGPSGRIYSIEKDGRALREQQSAMRGRFPDVSVEYMTADFTHRLELPPLNGIVMANSLHFIRDKAPVLALMHGYLKPDGRFVLVEYNADRGNTWVPYPLSYPTWETMARENGFSQTRKLAAVPSRFLGEIYSAVSSMTGTIGA